MPNVLKSPPLALPETISHDKRVDDRKLPRRWAFSMICILLAIAKLVTVSQNEILALQDDSLAYGRQALAKWTINVPPGYPAWLDLCMLTGLPQRICIEAFYLLACGFLATVIKRCFGLLSGCLIFAFLAFAPFTFFLFDHGLTDGFFACLTLLGLGLTFSILMAENTKHRLLYAGSLGVTLGVMAITRNEDPLLLAWILLLALASAVTWNRGLRSLIQWRFWRQSLFTAAAATTTYLLVLTGISLSYYFVNGVFARGIAIMPQHSKLLRNLAEIYTGQPSIRYAPISRRSRELAYAVSPTLARLKPQIEDGQDIWQNASFESGLPAGEVGAGWIWMAINSKMLPSVGNSPAAAERAYKKVNGELEQAFHDGRLKKRFILHPFLGADVAGIIHQFPASESEIVRCAMSSMTNYSNDDGVETVVFNKAFLRRVSLIQKASEVSLQGWAFVFSPGRKIQSVIVSSDLVVNAGVEAMERPDVSKGFLAQSGWLPSVIAFRSSLHSTTTDDVVITYILDDGSRIQAKHIGGNAVTRLPNATSPNSDVLQGIDFLKLDDSTNTSSAYKLQIWLVKLANSKNGHRISISIVAAAALLLIIFLIRRREHGLIKLFAVFFGFIVLTWCGRVVFYTLIDSAAWGAAQVRYLAPANALGVVLLALSISFLLTFPYKQSRLASKDL